MLPILNPVRNTRRLAILALVAFVAILLLKSPSSDLPSSLSGIYHDGIYASFFSNPPSPRSRLSLKMQELLHWDVPIEVTDHYPSYSDYHNRDYDPNRWEGFDRNDNYYFHGTLKQNSTGPTSPVSYNPYPAYASDDYQRMWRGQYTSCNGPDGSVIHPNTSKATLAYQGVPEGFPPPDSGSFEALGLDNSVCFDRISRLGSYIQSDDTQTNFGQVKWMDLQNQCLDRNRDRYEFPKRPDIGPTVPSKRRRSAQATETHMSNEASFKQRTAILIRTWDTYEYHENDLEAIRSLITELSLLTGGEYQVFLFVNVKDESEPLFTDRATYDRLVERYVPEELRDIAVLWTEAVCKSWYPNVGEWSVYYQQWMPLQYFSKTHPEYEHIWNWEMDARYVGNHYHFLEQIAKFARDQPRKYLWERNSRFYFPSAHGSYQDFVKDTNQIVEESKYVDTVWGPQRWSPEQSVFGMEPPTSEAEDNFTWGVGEEADFITLLPMWDPRETMWSYRDKLWGFPQAKDNGTADDPRLYPHVPRRVFINTLARLSRKLLDAMHAENTAGLSMASEMWPSSTALQHGLKGVYAPHPIYLSHHWPAEYLDLIFNADGWGAGSIPEMGGADFLLRGRGRAYDAERESRGEAQIGTGPNGEGALGRWSQERDNPYSPDREHNFGGWSWYFWSDFPKMLYWRWLGWNSVPGEATKGGSQPDPLSHVDWREWETENGRLCYPGMLLHPVKNVQH